ncbi:hypothetical protein [Umezawaea tangerina]|uniref:hypothetical protein n=1 Tax=Umezawaea tangerina TaxID=84725 RepID=UPI0011B22394|nr:hypothetical protein [Umezawaea tangerina]
MNVDLEVPVWWRGTRKPGTRKRKRGRHARERAPAPPTALAAFFGVVLLVALVLLVLTYA